MPIICCANTPNTPNTRRRTTLLTRPLLMAHNSSNPAVTANQGCMYKGVEQIDVQSRAAKVAELDKQLGVLEGLVVDRKAPVGDLLRKAMGPVAVPWAQINEPSTGRDLPVSVAQPNDLEPRRRHRRASDQLRELLA